MFVDKNLLAESFSLNSWHRWPSRPPLWFCGIVASLACSAGALGLLVFGR